jgi:hypothetical protein
VLPTGTLPKFKVAGLALRAPVGGGVVPVVEVTELLLALVTPVQPDKIVAANKRVPDKKRTKTRGVGNASLTVNRWREREVWAWEIIT